MLAITGGRVIDPAMGRDEPATLLVQDRRIAAIVPPGEPVKAEERIDATGCLVTPGLVDFHAHPHPGVEFGFEPDEIYPPTGVTAVGDAGTTGAATFEPLRRVMAQSHMEMRAFLHISVLGIVNLRRMADLALAEFVDEAAFLKVIEQHRDRLLGLKLRYQADQLGPFGHEAIGMAARLARRAGVPMAVHVTGAPVPLPEYIEHFQPGDILMHPYHGKGPGGLLDAAGKVHAAARAARERGVLFDLGRAVTHFDWAVAEAAAAEGFWPDMLSTDLTLGGVAREELHIPGILAQFLHLGLGLSDALARVTVQPARAMGLGSGAGTLRPGADANVTVMRLAERPRLVPDHTGATRTVRPWLEPILTLVKGRVAFGGPLEHPKGP